jgi:hypothetical protein
VYMPTIVPKDGCAVYLKQRCDKFPSFWRILNRLVPASLVAFLSSCSCSCSRSCLPLFPCLSLHLVPLPLLHSTPLHPHFSFRFLGGGTGQRSCPSSWCSIAWCWCWCWCWCWWCDDFVGCGVGLLVSCLQAGMVHSIILLANWVGFGWVGDWPQLGQGPSMNEQQQLLSTSGCGLVVTACVVLYCVPWPSACAGSQFWKLLASAMNFVREFLAKKSRERERHDSFHRFCDAVCAQISWVWNGNVSFQLVGGRARIMLLLCFFLLGQRHWRRTAPIWLIRWAHVASTHSIAVWR